MLLLTSKYSVGSSHKELQFPNRSSLSDEKLKQVNSFFLPAMFCCWLFPTDSSTFPGFWDPQGCAVCIMLFQGFSFSGSIGESQHHAQWGCELGPPAPLLPYSSKSEPFQEGPEVSTGSCQSDDPLCWPLWDSMWPAEGPSGSDFWFLDTNSGFTRSCFCGTCGDLWRTIEWVTGPVWPRRGLWALPRRPCSMLHPTMEAVALGSLGTTVLVYRYDNDFTHTHIRTFLSHLLLP